MIVQDYVNGSTMSKHYYIKRKLIKDQALIYNGSIFPSSENNQTSQLIHKDQIKKFQTITTNIDHTVTLRSNNDEEISNSERKSYEERSQLLPRIYTTSQTKYSKHSNKKMKTQQRQVKHLPIRQTTLINHISDPLYLKLQKTIVKRINVNHNRYKRQWMDSSLRRKGKSVIQRSLEKAAATIESINSDSTKRRTTHKFVELLRNNHAQNKFTFPAKIRLDIQGLKGKGGKVIPIIRPIFKIQEVYKYDKSV